MEDPKFYIANRTRRVIASTIPTQLSRSQMNAIGDGDPNIVYQGTITIPGTADIIKLSYDNGDTDETTFDNTEAVAGGGMAGTFREVFFNKIQTLAAGDGEVYFTGVKATLRD